uniref:Uncharacterized protein n=1 Tax=Arundo donax TaxID=35708 RepID=A0A0A9FYZ1_ARUDO
MLQQRLLRQGRRHQPAGDELSGGGLLVRRRVRPERVAGDVWALLCRPPIGDAVPGAGYDDSCCCHSKAAQLLPV